MYIRGRGRDSWKVLIFHSAKLKTMWRRISIDCSSLADKSCTSHCCHFVLERTILVYTYLHVYSRTRLRKEIASSWLLGHIATTKTSFGANRKKEDGNQMSYLIIWLFSLKFSQTKYLRFAGKQFLHIQKFSAFCFKLFQKFWLFSIKLSLPSAAMSS